ncbi:hypothetical protein [Qipengyuania oceanensis]|uniref:Spore coat protein U domain-containing protein n=1 Tax=Qipengyuania oceanensis TaxID=1463597 RepID=A0A844YFZ9_9SPHN|nr:hypothetical protein [Qipengyuania oceanensis]MXO63440.1 hypothetical protein [Qipengyuania oceanensis]
MKNPFLILCAGAIAAMPAGLHAQSKCEPKFLQSSQTVFVDDFDAGSNSFAIENFDIRVRNAAGPGGGCTAILRVARSLRSPNPEAVGYQLQLSGQQIQILPNESSPPSAGSDYRISNVPGGTNGANLPFRLGVPSGWGVKSGSRTDELVVQLVDAKGVITDTLNLTIVIDVPPAAEVRVVGATGTDAIAQVDLGVLDPKQTTISDLFGIRVWSNSPYSVRFLSQNCGELVQTQNRGRIPYEILLNQTPVSTTGGLATQVPRATTALGDFHPLRVRVAPFSAYAGDYSDRVEVTVTAN